MNDLNVLRGSPMTGSNSQTNRIEDPEGFPTVKGQLESRNRSCNDPTFTN